LRKRRVRVSRLIRIARLQKVFVDAAHSDVHCRLLNAYLLDQNAADGACQIVSNVYTIKAHTRGRDPHTWIFSTSEQEASLDYPSFIVRSNYKQKSVVLCLEATTVSSNQVTETINPLFAVLQVPSSVSTIKIPNL
uniref:Myotubularin phosphatase domain-containing protein n=1 Tax=Gongylonema pulchrum TaxID=637853 RepID=A0A183EHY4_9BILA